MEQIPLLQIIVKDVPLELETSEGLFSPAGLDAGTQAMLSQITFQPGERVLDLGCGYGAVGILAARIVGAENVTLCDISEEAVKVSRRNAVRNGVGKVSVSLCDGPEEAPGGPFTWILSNPPYHADFSVPKGFIEKGWRRLEIGGRLVMVTKRLEWYRNKLTAVFGGVQVREIDGYYVFLAEKRKRTPRVEVPRERPLSKKLQKKYGRKDDPPASKKA